MGDAGEVFAENGRPKRAAPKWAKVRDSMKNHFPSYHYTPIDSFATEVHESIKLLNTLKPPKDGPAFLGSDPSGPDYREVTDAELPEEGKPLADVVDESVDLFNGMMNLAHPLCMPNVIPNANKAGIIGAMMADTFSPNIIEGEYAWGVEKAEMESAAMVARLIGWDPLEAGGIYTYGGSGCYLYGMKYALTQVLGVHSRCHGIRTDGKLLVSQQGHYAKMNSTDWTGLGMNNIVDIETDDDSNAMDIEDLECKMKYYHKRGIPIISIVATMGTTDAFAIDPVDKIRALINKYPNKKEYGPTFLYCDAVIGWSFLTFNNYDFEKNHLKFTKPVLDKIKRNYDLIKTIKHADAVGIDFHKTGWAPYNCSLFMMKKLNHFRELLTRPGSAYLQERTPYNPGLYSCEVSRSGAYAMAGWATLNYFGHNGFQSVLGGILELSHFLRGRLKKEECMVCANKDDHGFVTLIRVYPEGVDAEEQYENELSKKEYQDDLVKYNKLQQDTANVLWDWFRSGQKIEGMYGPYTSYTSGFRTTDYNDDFSNSRAVVYALKSFPMNVNTNHHTMNQLIKMIKIARDCVLNKKKPESHHETELVGPPYNKPNPAVDCGTGDEDSRARVHDLLSGVVGGRKRRVGRHHEE